MIATSNFGKKKSNSDVMYYNQSCLIEARYEVVILYDFSYLAFNYSMSKLS